MSEQWEVMWWAGSRLGGERASPDTPVRTPEGWETVRLHRTRLLAPQTRPDALRVTGFTQQSQLNEYPVPPWCRRTT